MKIQTAPLATLLSSGCTQRHSHGGVGNHQTRSNWHRGRSVYRPWPTKQQRDRQTRRKQLGTERRVGGETFSSTLGTRSEQNPYSRELTVTAYALSSLSKLRCSQRRAAIEQYTRLHKSASGFYTAKLLPRITPVVLSIAFALLVLGSNRVYQSQAGRANLHLPHPCKGVRAL